MPRPSAFAKPMATLRREALSFPETTEDHPWGESAFKVKGKVFLFMSIHGTDLSLSMKLPQSKEFALVLPFARPTGYGLGKSGWITATFAPGEPLPMPLLLDWLEESFHAVAPKRVAAALEQKANDAPRRRRR